MQLRLIPLAVLVALLATAGSASAATRYHVSVGDSLAAGYKPNPAGGAGLVTREGYPEQLLATARKKIRSLKLVKYGCPGETTGTMISGRCSGALTAAQRSSQLERAERFLKRNRRKVSFVTYSIGADDLLPCITAGYVVDTFCIAAALQTFEANSRTINRRLRKAAGARVRIAQLLYYNPFVALLAHGSEYSSTASLTNQLIDQLNRLIRAEGRRRKFRFADASKALDSTAEICALTWMCTPFADIHANKAGHAVLAARLERALRL